jgi:hypothetical protein
VEHGGYGIGAAIDGGDVDQFSAAPGRVAGGIAGPAGGILAALKEKDIAARGYTAQGRIGTEGGGLLVGSSA